MSEDSYTSIPVDNRPTDYEYALLSEHVYKGKVLNQDDCLPEDNKWKIIKIKNGESGYFGVIYINHQIKQIVLSHRGTKSLKAVLEDIKGIMLNLKSKQKIEAFDFVDRAIKLINEGEELKDYRLSFTGHSLGAFLAELSVYYCHSYFKYTNVNAVTFESPGSKESMEDLQSNLESIILEQLDIVGYVGYPNLINTYNKHVGTLFQVNTNLGSLGWLPVRHLLKAHSLKGIKELFREADNNVPPRLTMSDWPLFTQKDIYFKNAKFDKGHYSLIEKQVEKEVLKAKDKFKLAYKGHYRGSIELNVLPLRHFSPKMQDFLRDFHKKYSSFAPDEYERLKEKWIQNKISEEIIKYLRNYQIERDSTGIEKIVLINELKTTQVHHFRHKLSNWLNKTGHNAFKLLGLAEDTNNRSGSSVPITSSIIQAGGKLGKNGVLVKPKASGFSINMTEGASEQDSRNAGRLVQQTLNGVGSIQSHIIARDAECDGRIINGISEGVSITISPRNGGTN